MQGVENNLNGTQYSEVIRDLRYQIRTNANAKFNGSLEMSRYWFENMTLYIDAMLELEVREPVHLYVYNLVT